MAILGKLVLNRLFADTHEVVQFTGSSSDSAKFLRGDSTWASPAGVGVGYNTIDEEGVALTQRVILNFIGAAITAADDAGNTRTNVTLAQVPSGSTQVVGIGRTINTTAPITGGGDLSADRTIAMPVATSIASGYLSSTDWSTFNAKVPATRTISTTSPLAGGGDLSANRTLSITSPLPIANGGTNNASAYTAGSVIFSNGTSLTQDNTNFKYNDTSNELQLGTVATQGATLSADGILVLNPANKAITLLNSLGGSLLAQFDAAIGQRIAFLAISTADEGVKFVAAKTRSADGSTAAAVQDEDTIVEYVMQADDGTAIEEFAAWGCYVDGPLVGADVPMMFAFHPYSATAGGTVGNAFRIRGDGAYYGTMDTMTYAATISLAVKKGNLHKTTTVHATGNATINASAAGDAGQHLWVLVANDATSGKTITFGTNFRPTGTVVGTASKVATVHFISDGTAWFEVSRTLAL